MIAGRNALVGVILSGVLFLNAQPERVQQTSRISTAVPIVFTRGIDASKAKPGDMIATKTIQEVFLPNGSEIPKGTTILGHVTDARSFSFDPAPYAIQQPSVLSIHFDAVLTKDGTTKAIMSVRALADWSDSEDAMRPQPTDEHDIVGTMFLIGGDSYRADEKSVTSQDGDIVGYSRKGGVFARLLQSEYTSRYSHFECEGSGDAEQSVGIFSPSACGLYGLQDVYMADNGLGEDLGTFRLESRRHTVKLYAQSTALLQIISNP